MTFGKSRMIFKSNGKYDYGLLRFCSLKGYTIIGGASKLFKTFVKNTNPNSIVSYANYDISNGDVYRKLQFNLEDKIYPGFWWCKDGKKFHRSNFMKHKLLKNENDTSKTASEIMRNKGYFKVWNSGNLKFIWTKL